MSSHSADGGGGNGTPSTPGAQHRDTPPPPLPTPGGLRETMTVQIRNRLIKATLGIVENLEQQIAFHREALKRLTNES